MLIGPHALTPDAVSQDYVIHWFIFGSIKIKEIVNCPRSSVKAEYHSMIAAASKLTWFQYLLKDLHLKFLI